MECLRLRVKDVDFGYSQILVRDGKGEKDRITMLPRRLIDPLRTQLQKVRQIHDLDLQEGFGEVHLPYALARKYPRAGFEWGWQYVFPSKNRSHDPEDGVIRRHHLDETVLQRALRSATRTAGTSKPLHCHTFRHYAEFRTMPSRTACGLGGTSRSGARTRHRFVEPTGL